MRGFTLLEILIAVSVLGLIMAMLYGAYASSAETIRIAEAQGGMDQAARIVLTRMRRELASAVAGEGLSLSGENGEIDGMPAGRLEFTAATGAGSCGGADLCRIRYLARAAPEEGRLELLREEEGLIRPGIAVGGHAEPWTRMLQGLAFTFQDTGGDSHDSWDSGSAEGGGLPAYVEIRLTLAGPSGESRTFVTGVHPEARGAIR